MKEEMESMKDKIEFGASNAANRTGTRSSTIPKVCKARRCSSSYVEVLQLELPVSLKELFVSGTRSAPKSLYSWRRTQTRIVMSKIVGNNMIFCIRASLRVQIQKLSRPIAHKCGTVLKSVSI